jgi:hypothetical protein
MLDAHQVAQRRADHGTSCLLPASRTHSEPRSYAFPKRIFFDSRVFYNKNPDDPQSEGLVCASEL